MTTILFLDTETNGLPKNRFAPPSEFDAYPAILQLSWAIYTVSGKTMTLVSSRDIGVSLDPSIAWDTGAAAIHGLSEIEARHGSSTKEALLELGRILRTVDKVAAHNLAFDKPVIRAAGYAEASRTPDSSEAAALRNLWPTPLKEICTMRLTRDIMRLPSPNDPLGRFKPPRLNELYTWLHGHAYSGAALHSAKADVICLADCFTQLLVRDLVTV